MTTKLVLRDTQQTGREERRTDEQKNDTGQMGELMKVKEEETPGRNRGRGGEGKWKGTRGHEEGQEEIQKEGNRKGRLKGCPSLFQLVTQLEGERAGKEGTGECCDLFHCDSASTASRFLQEETMLTSDVRFVQKRQVEGQEERGSKNTVNKAHI